MEDEAFYKAFYMAWVFYPCFIVIGLVQILLLCLYIKRYHPFAKILEGVEKQEDWQFSGRGPMKVKRCEKCEVMKSRTMGRSQEKEK